VELELTRSGKTSDLPPLRGQISESTKAGQDQSASTTDSAATQASITSHQPNTKASPTPRERPNDPVSTEAGQLHQHPESEPSLDIGATLAQASQTLLPQIDVLPLRKLVQIA
jgi:hypothetical protein